MLKPVRILHCIGTKSSGQQSSNLWVRSPLRLVGLICFLVAFGLNAFAPQAYAAQSNTFSARDISCVSARQCVAVGTGPRESSKSEYEVDVTENGGEAWTVVAVPGHFDGLTSVSCWIGISCVAVGGSSGTNPTVMYSSHRGREWRDAALPTRHMVVTSISCRFNHCVVVGGAGSAYALISKNGGLTWRESAFEKGNTSFGILSSVSCPTVRHCVAVGGGLKVGLVTTDGGSTWSRFNVATHGWNLKSVTCSSKRHCVSVGTTVKGQVEEAQQIIVESTDGGKSWREAVIPDTVGSGLRDVSCARSACVAINYYSGALGGNNLLTSSNAGRSWISNNVLKQYSLGSVECMGIRQCVLANRGPAGPVMFGSTNGGLSWKSGRTSM
jgi:hypothetical protein